MMPGQLQPEGGGFGVNTVAAADRERIFVLERTGLQRRQHGVDVGQQQIGRLRQLHRQAGVQHVGAGHALMHEPAVRPNRLGQPGQEGDDVMPGFPLDRVDAIDIGGADGGELRTAFVADAAGGLLRDGADSGHALGGQRLDLEPDAVAVLGCPDGGHFGSGVSRNHRCLVRSGERAS